MTRSRTPYRWMDAVLLVLAISAVGGHMHSARAQFSESQEFFDDGELEFEQEAETLEQLQDSSSAPIVTVEEEPADTNEQPAGESESRNPIPPPDAEVHEE